MRTFRKRATRETRLLVLNDSRSSDRLLSRIVDLQIRSPHRFYVADPPFAQANEENWEELIRSFLGRLTAALESKENNGRIFDARLEDGILQSSLQTSGGLMFRFPKSCRWQRPPRKWRSALRSARMVLTSTGPIWISISDGNNFNRLSIWISGVECKHDKSRVKRDRVQELWAKIQSVGAHKGILFATAGFHSGANRIRKISWHCSRRDCGWTQFLCGQNRCSSSRRAAPRNERTSS